MVESKLPLSVIIPTKNEGKNIARCLDSVTWAEECFVVDSQSNDRTCEIAEKKGAIITQFVHDGGWPKKKNWALDNLPFKHEWALILDADETLPPEAKDEIRDILQDQSLTHVGYWINRRFFFLGKQLNHAYFPNWNLRLFKHRIGRYEKLTDIHTNSGDNEIHEHIVVKGTTGRLKSIMNHYAFPTIESFVEKHNRYSNWEAVVDQDSEYPLSKLQNNQVNARRRLKRLFKLMPFRPTLRFLYVYILQRGFLDGWAGYIFARLHGQYEFLSISKSREYNIRKNQDAHDNL